MVEWDEPTATDDSGTAALDFQNYFPGSFFEVNRPVEIIYRFSDPFGNEATCTFTVSVTRESGGDTTPPVITGCPGTIKVSAAAGSNTVTSTWVEPIATDNSGVTPIRSRSHTPGSEFPVGANTVIYIFSDGSGNTESCIFQVIVSTAGDNIPPVVTGCPNTVQVSAPTGRASAIATWIEPTASDDSGVTPVRRRSYTPGSSYPVGTTVVTYRFSDPSGNVATCQFDVVVTASGGGGNIIVNNCPNDMNMIAPQGTSFYQADWEEPSAINTNGGVVSVISSHTPPRFFEVPSVNEITYTFSSDAGDRAECVFNISVSTSGDGDTIAPVISGCPINSIVFSVSTPAGVVCGLAFWTEPTATDNSGVTPTRTRSHVPGDCLNIGSTTVTYTFRDMSSNSAMCQFQVVVMPSGGVDTSPPVIMNCPNDRTEIIATSSTTVEWIEPSATDDSGITPTRSRSNTPGSEFNVGTTVVTYTFTDGSGNTAMCTFNVIVQRVDDTPPQFQPPCPYERVENIPTPCDNEVIVSFELAMPTDDSQPVTVIPNPFAEILDVGIHQRVFTAWDAVGNIDQCTVSIDVRGFDCGDSAGEPPAAPQFGFIVSSNCTDVIYQCDEGYRVIGESHLQCGNDGNWNNMVPSCEAILCDALGELANGYIFCLSEPLGVGSRCYIGCNSGFKLTENTTFVDCLQDGTVGQWSQDLTNAACQDNRAPNINCPGSFIVTLPEEASSASVTWTIPTAAIEGQQVPIFHSDGLTPLLT
ncbi:hyalin-like [Amphiura filiformis]|uniref:hyalin-like n=1 Tax=Amphiura filiformis TaxID=82378 RepID=UPI003B22328B